MDGLKNFKILYKAISFGKTEKDKTFQAPTCPSEG